MFAVCNAASRMSQRDIPHVAERARTAERVRATRLIGAAASRCRFVTKATSVRLLPARRKGFKESQYIAGKDIEPP
jgi:hypothetical protein